MSKEVLFVEQKVCEINGLRVSYIDEGAPVKGTVLLLHGWGVTASLYHLVIGHLATRYRVVAPDLPGFGGSQEPSAPWCVADYADFIKAFAAGVGVEEAVLVGHSYGCRIAIRLLADKALPVKKAVFMGAAGVKPRRSLWFYIRQAGYKCGRWFLSLPPVKKCFPGALDNLRNRRASADYRNASPVMRQTLVRSIGEDLTPLLPAVAVPVLLLFGDSDTATPVYMGRVMESRIPDAGLVILHGGHYAFAEQWGQCSRILDSFL